MIKQILHVTVPRDLNFTESDQQKLCDQFSAAAGSGGVVVTTEGVKVNIIEVYEKDTDVEVDCDEEEE